jgi:hypothetical protein
MAAWKDQIFEDWWPLGQSMILVRAPIPRVAKAVREEAQRLNEGSSHKRAVEWIRRPSLDAFFRGIEKFSHGTGMSFYLPTRVGWTVALTNDASCGPYYSLAHCLSKFRKLETICFMSHDRPSTFTAGTVFTHFRPGPGEELIERNIRCCDTGSRWSFLQNGDPLPEEDLERYKAKRKRDRLNEEGLMQLLDRLGIQPWREATYDFQTMCFRMFDVKGLEEAEAVPFEEIRAQALRQRPLDERRDEDAEIEGPPDYLRGLCAAPQPDGPSALLADDGGCDREDSRSWIYDIRTDGSDTFTVRLPENQGPPVVEVSPKSGGASHVIYDSRRHPANPFVDSQDAPQFRPIESCAKCGSKLFQVSVSFQVHADCSSPNDTNLFALALKCAECGDSRLAYDDETA